MSESSVDGPQSTTGGQSGVGQQLMMDDNQPDHTDHSFPQRKLNRKYHCGECNSYTYDPRTYLEHRKRMHGEVFSIHNCLVCNYASKHPNKVSRHMKFVHQVPALNLVEWRTQMKEFATDDSRETEQSSTPSLLTASTAAKMFKCTICRSFESLLRSALLDHVRQQHGHVEIFNCTLCSYSHYIKDRFRRHVKYHTMQKIRCKICDFETVYKWNMERHMRHHTDIGKDGIFACDLCGYSATAKQSITAHKLTHHSSMVTDAAPSEGSVGDGEYDIGDDEAQQAAAVGDNFGVNFIDYSVFVDGLAKSGTVSSAESTAADDKLAGGDTKSHGDEEESLPINMLQLVWKNEKNQAKGECEAAATIDVIGSPTPIPSALSAFSLDGMNISIFKCPFCTFVTQESMRFHKHFTTHTTTNEYNCSACRFGARFAWDVRRHIIASHRQANVLSSSNIGCQSRRRNYQEYTDALVITERSLDTSTIVADINLRSNPALLLGQYLSLNAPLVANDETAIEKSISNVFKHDWKVKEEKDDRGSLRMRYRCGRCLESSEWVHVIEVTLNLPFTFTYSNDPTCICGFHIHSAIVRRIMRVPRR